MIFIGMDLGSSGCKAAAFDENGVRKSFAARRYAARRKPGGVLAYDAEELDRCLLECIAECAGNAPEKVAAIAFSSFGKALVPLDTHGRICGDSIPGADTRANACFAAFARRFGPEKLQAITGQPYGFGYSRPALLPRPQEYARTHTLLSWADYAGFRLTGRAAFCKSLAARTLLYDVRQECWFGRNRGGFRHCSSKNPYLPYV